MLSESRRARPRILVLTSSYPSSRNKTSALFISEWVESMSSTVDIVVLTPQIPDALSNKLESADIYNFFHWPTWFNPKLTADVDLHYTLQHNLLAWFELFPFCINFYTKALELAKGVDAICSHWLIPSGFIGSYISNQLKIPHLVIEHAGGAHLLNKIPGGKKILNYILNASNSCITVSQELKNSISKILPQFTNKIHVVPMGVSTVQAQKVCSLSQEALKEKYLLPKDKLILFFMGRHVDIKGLPVVIKAIQNKSDVLLVVAGNGPCRNRWEQQALGYNSPSCFIGEVYGEKKWELLAASDIFVIPSIKNSDGRTEGLPVVCLEALSIGTPILASNVGGLPELIKNGENGWLMPASNVNSWSEAISYFVKNRNELKKMKVKNQFDYSNFGWEKRGQEYISHIYQALYKNEK